MRLLCCLFQAHQLSTEVEERVFNILHHLSAKQRRLLERIWTIGWRLHEKDTGKRSYDRYDLEISWLRSCGSTLERELEEAIMDLNVSLII